MFKALYTLQWFGLLRPGEATLTSRYPTYDVSRHPSVEDVVFMEGESTREVGDGGAVPTRMHFCIKDSKTDYRRLTAEVVIGRTGDAEVCAVTAMWAYLHTRVGCVQEEPLFMHRSGKALKYMQLRNHLTKVLEGTGMSKKETQRYGGHSFRVGGAQGLALSNHSLPYIMCYGRWRSVESVMTYVTTPMHMREKDARAMLMGVAEGTAAQASTALLRDEGMARAVLSGAVPSRWG